MDASRENPQRPLRNCNEWREKNAPAAQKRSRGTGTSFVRLLRSEVLVIAQRVNVLELRRGRGQVARVQEQHVKVVVTSRRAVHRGAALERAGVVLRVIHADQRAVVVQGVVPSLEIAEEVVQSSVGSEVLANAG